MQQAVNQSHSILSIGMSSPLVASAVSSGNGQLVAMSPLVIGVFGKMLVQRTAFENQIMPHKSSDQDVSLVALRYHTFSTSLQQALAEHVVVPERTQEETTLKVLLDVKRQLRPHLLGLQALVREGCSPSDQECHRLCDLILLPKGDEYNYDQGGGEDLVTTLMLDWFLDSSFDDQLPHAQAMAQCTGLVQLLTSSPSLDASSDCLPSSHSPSSHAIEATAITRTTTAKEVEWAVLELHGVATMRAGALYWQHLEERFSPSRAHARLVARQWRLGFLRRLLVPSPSPAMRLANGFSARAYAKARRSTIVHLVSILGERYMVHIALVKTQGWLDYQGLRADHAECDPRFWAPLDESHIRLCFEHFLATFHRPKSARHFLKDPRGIHDFLTRYPLPPWHERLITDTLAVQLALAHHELRLLGHHSFEHDRQHPREDACGHALFVEENALMEQSYNRLLRRAEEATEQFLRGMHEYRSFDLPDKGVQIVYQPEDPQVIRQLTLVEIPADPSAEPQVLPLKRLAHEPIVALMHTNKIGRSLMTRIVGQFVKKIWASAAASSSVPRQSRYCVTTDLLDMIRAGVQERSPNAKMAIVNQ
jgi:hypothetical protein